MGRFAKITIKKPTARCSFCGGRFLAGASAWWDAVDRRLECAGCRQDGERAEQAQQQHDARFR